MQITLNETEIKKAIIAFVGEQGISITGKNVDVTLTAGRAPNGMSASIDISNDEITPLKSITVEVSETKESNGLPGLTFNQAMGKAESETKVEEPPLTPDPEQKPLFGKG